MWGAGQVAGRQTLRTVPFDPEETCRSADSGPLACRMADRRPERGILPTVRPSTLFAYALFAYSGCVIFVGLAHFVAFRNKYWTDEDLRALQSFLLVSPEAGDLVRGGSGLRKLRWSAQGRGKRGGARVIYYWHKPKHHVYLIYGCVKSEREELTPQQIRVLAELMKDVKDG